MRISSLILFCFLALIGSTQPLLVLQEQFDAIYIGDYCMLYEDSSNLETILEIRQKANSVWQIQHTPEIMGEISTSNFWTHCKISNPNNDKISLALSVENSYLDKVQFFCFNKQILVDSSKLMGDVFPFSKRIIDHRFFIHQIEIGPKETWDIYCLSGKKGGKMEFSLKVYPSSKLLPELHYNLLKKISFSALIILAILVGLLFFFISGDKVALFFALLNLFSLLWLLGKEGLGFQYLWPTATTFQQGATILFFSFCFLFQSLLLISLFHISYKSLAGKLIFFAVFIQLTGIAVILSPLLFDDHQVVPYYTWISYYTHSAALTNIILTLAGCILYAIQDRNRDMLTFTAAYLLQLFSITIALSSWLTSNYFNITNIYEFIASIWSTVSIIILYLLIKEYIRKSNQNEVLQLQFSKKQSQALQNLLVGQEIERKRLSQELHDGLSIRIAQLKQYISNNRIEGISSRDISNIIKDIDSIHQDIRHFSHALNPVVLEQLGFKKAIDNIIFTLENTYAELDIQFLFPDHLQLTLAQEKHFYYIVQELLNNTIKHGKADTILLQFKALDKGFKFTYEDNGIGFDLKTVNGGIGLQNIQARAELLNGIFKIEKIIPKGMRQGIFLSD